MKKQFILWTIISAMVMLILPCLVLGAGVIIDKVYEGVGFNVALAVIFLLFCIVNPIYMVIIGIYAGKDTKHLCGLPVIAAVLFLIGTWICIDMGEPMFVKCAVGYIILGICAMLISEFIRKRKNQNYTYRDGDFEDN